MCYINALDNTFAFQVIVKLPLPSKGIRKFCLWNPKPGKTLFVCFYHTNKTTELFILSRHE